YSIVFARGRAAARRGRPSPPRSGPNPLLEVLEDRTVPATLGEQPALLAGPTGQPSLQQELATLLHTEQQLTNLASQAHGNGLFAREVATLVRAEEQLVNLVTQQIGSGSGSGSASGSSSASASGSGSGSGSASGS